MRYFWLLVRLAFLIYWVRAGWLGLGGPNAGFPLSTAHVLFAIGAGTLGARFWLIRPYLRKERTEPWLAPSWFENPLNPSQPFQFMHVFGISFVLMAVAAVVRGPRSTAQAASSFLPMELFGGGFGLGLLIGIYWALHAYREQFKAHVSPQNVK